MAAISHSLRQFRANQPLSPTVPIDERLRDGQTVPPELAAALELVNCRPGHGSATGRLAASCHSVLATVHPPHAGQGAAAGRSPGGTCDDRQVARRRFSQVDVFTTTPYAGNPVAVVLGAEGLETETMQRFAHWTNLSETTFLLPAQDPSADYRLRIFTAERELLFAGHPTLGSCHAWLQAGGTPAIPNTVVQECGAGLVQIRRTDGGLAFAAPPLLRSGPVSPELVAHVADVLRINQTSIVDTQWVDNGPGWLGVLLHSADAVLSLRPGVVDLDIGVVGPYPAGSPEALEVRALFPIDGRTVEDPVTGSLNASLAGWLTSTGRVTAPYTARQGTVLGRLGRVQVAQDDDGTIWTGGGTVTCIDGHVDL